jgi:transcription elongation factor Elf1
MIDPLLDEFVCLYCLQEDTVRLRLDKRANPYTLCHACGARTFLKSIRCLRGLALMTDSANALLANLSRDRDLYEAAQRRVAEFTQAVKLRRAGTSRTLTAINEVNEGKNGEVAAAAVATR